MGGWFNPQLAQLTEETKKHNKPQKVGILKIFGLGLWTLIVACVPSYFSYKLGESKQLTIPTTVVDRYGNKLHLEEPVAHKGYYEYPIIIYDKMNNYRRIDKYAFGKELGIKFDGVPLIYWVKIYGLFFIIIYSVVFLNLPKIKAVFFRK